MVREPLLALPVLSVIYIKIIVEDFYILFCVFFYKNLINIVFYIVS